jgi:hypothetical protein
MADEIDHANVITVVALTPAGPWRASIGPEGLGIARTSATARGALKRLMVAMGTGWPFDPTWKPPRKPPR